MTEILLVLIFFWLVAGVGELREIRKTMQGWERVRRRNAAERGGAA